MYRKQINRLKSWDNELQLIALATHYYLDYLKLANHSDISWTKEKLVICVPCTNAYIRFTFTNIILVEVSSPNYKIEKQLYDISEIYAYLEKFKYLINQEK